MKQKLEGVRINLEKVMAIQLVFQSFVEENEERAYELTANLDDDDRGRDEKLSFEVVLEMIVARLKR
ncbi:hypothetical protein PHMEG_00012495 [Phytophthora megakarya]|uniref:Uncharacterized protein n=1 Tax=Phytophthora megakarya TaxID=4795 RepID=A0A225W8J0_9STRA|nr:hypothetical protein PHMEG_00012495 [Phytophthora megakarya]